VSAFGDGRPLLSGIVVGGTYRTIPWADYPGIYEVIPVVSRASGSTDVLRLNKWFFVVCWGAMLLALPLFFYAVSGSLLVAVLAPLLVRWRFDFVADSDLYWVPVWTALVCLPALMLLARARRIHAGALAGVLVVASFGDSIRAPTGIVALVVALVLVLRSHDTRARRAALCAVALVSYLSLTTIVPTGLRAYRDHALHGRVTAEAPRTVWHTLYLGFGYLPNRYGIHYSDLVAYDAAREARPGVALYGPEYSVTLRTLVWRVVREDPGLVADDFWSKLQVTARDGLHRFGSILFLVPVLLLLGRREHRRRLVIAGVGVVAALTQPLVAIPLTEYELAFFGALGLLWLVALLSLVELGEEAVRARLQGRRPALATRRPELLLPSLSVGALLGVLAVAAFAPPTARGRAAREKPAPAGALLLPSHPPVSFNQLEHFDLAAAQRDSRLEFEPGSSRRALPGRLRVRTTRLASGYQLLTPATELAPGAYAAVLRGNIATGGLAIGALDVRRDAWLQTAVYFEGQRGLGRRPMYVGFTLRRPTRVRLILANAHPAGRSTWTLKTLALSRLRCGRRTPELCLARLQLVGEVRRERSLVRLG
jgi:hypothetical protein